VSLQTEQQTSHQTSPLDEWPLAVSILTTGLFLIFSKGWFAHLSNPWWFGFILAWLFAVILSSAFAIVRHAEALAERVGEPLGTLILTLAVTGMEVMMIAAVMYGGTNPTLARDSMFAVVMLVLNGMVGLALLVGGLKHREQTYNLQGANAFLAVILPLAALGLILPNYTSSSPGPTLSSMHAVFLIVMSVVLYSIFLAIQTTRHRGYFVHNAAPDHAHAHGAHTASIPFHTTMLLCYLLPMVVLSKKLAAPINHGIDVLKAPPALGGLLVAILILSPESLAAVRAAIANQLQRSINILLGSVLATIGLTIPATLIVGFMTGQTIILGVNAVCIILLVLTLAVSMLTFASARTNVLLGAIHLLLFGAYLMMIFD
jgi:Ca2+:H+ antiporter